MNWADYTIIGVLLLSVVVGLWRGLISEVLALAVWVAALWVAWGFGDRVAALFANSIELPSARLLLGYACCFFAVLLLGALLRFILHKLVEGTGLGGSDRMLGMVFGLARGVLVVVLTVMLLGFTPFPRDPWWQESRLLPSFADAAGWLATRLPDEVGRHLDFDPAQLRQSMAGKWLPAGATPAVAPEAAPSAQGPGQDRASDRTTGHD